MSKERKFKDEEKNEKKFTPKKGKGKGKGKKARTPGGIEGRDVPPDKGGHSESGVTLKGTNDLSWYVSNTRLLEDTTNISFNLPIGVNIPEALTRGSSTFEAYVAKPGSTQQQWFYNNPGVMSINLIPMYGISNDTSSALNLAADQNYAFVRFNNSGARNYESPDQMMYYLAMDSLFSLYTFMIRAYGTLSHYSYWNKYVPKTLFTAMGLDYDSFQNNYAQFRADINLFAKKLSTYCVPNSLPIFNRHSQMFGNIYKDSESPKAQLIMYNPACYWKYSPATDTKGTELIPVTFRGNQGTSPDTVAASLVDYSTFWKFANELIKAVDDEDFNIMSGDILKAYGSDGIWKQEFIPIDVDFEPIFDFSWLTQIQNAYAVDAPMYRTSNTDFSVCKSIADPANKWISNNLYIKQQIPAANVGSPYIITKVAPRFEEDSNVRIFGHKLLLSSPYNTPKPGDIMESTRLMPTGHMQSGSTHDTAVVDSCGGEVVANIELFMTGQQGTSYGITMLRVPTHVQMENSNTDRFDMLRLAFMDNFAMHPTLYFVNHDTTANKFYLDGIFADLDNFTIVDEEFIQRTHDVATLSMLYTRNAGMLEPKG